MANRATNDASQHIPAVFIRREYTIINEHRCRARVFCKHSQTKAVAIFVVANLIFATGERLTLLNEREQHIGFPNGVSSLHQRKNSLETSTRVDRWFRQRRARSIFCLVELHEHQVPKLEKAISLRIVQRSAFWSEGWSTIDMNFRTWTTWTRLTHLPKVVFVAKALNAIHWHANLFVPNCLSLIITFMNGDP